MTAIDEECEGTHHKLCLFHMVENLMKHGRGLGQGILAAVKGTFHAAAYAQTEEVGNRCGHVKCFSSSSSRFGDKGAKSAGCERMLRGGGATLEHVYRGFCCALQ